MKRRGKCNKLAKQKARDKRVKAKKRAKRQRSAKFAKQSKLVSDWARERQATTDFAVFTKPEGGKWQLEFNSPNEECRDTAFAILEQRTDIQIRRVNI